MIRLVCGAVGLALLVGAVVSALSTRRFIAAASRAEGEVIALSAGGSHPRLRFTTADGQVVTFSGNGLVFGYRVGDHAPVLYLRDRADTTASLAARGSLWFLPIMLAFIGLGWLLVPLTNVAF